MTTKLREYSQLLQRLKYLVDRNRSDSDDADHVRELIDDCWRGLSEEDCQKAQELIDKLDLMEELY
jgi:hypothetical protein